MTDGYSVRELLLLAQNHIPPSQITLRGNIEGWLASYPASSDLYAQHAELVAALKEARQRLAKGRALWNGPCHECDAVLAAALKDKP